MEITPSYVFGNTLEGCMQELYAEDIVKSLRPFVEEYVVEARQFIHASLVSGFDRTIIQSVMPLMMSEIDNLVAMAEDAIAESDSPKTALLKNEVQALKTHLGICFKTLETMILQKPETENQMFLDLITMRRIK
jgi:mevalonate kinase